MSPILVVLFSISAVKMGLDGNDFATIVFTLAALASLYMYNIDIEKTREHKSRNEVIKALGESGDIIQLYYDWKEKQDEKD